MDLKENRNIAADVYKGIGVVLMLMGHIGFGEVFSHMIHAFHMPMFFWVSGFLYKETENLTFGNRIRKKAVSLLVPYFMFGLVNYIIWAMMIVWKGYQWGLKDFLNPLVHLLTINTTKLPIAGALWFLTALFWTNLFFMVLHCFIKEKRIAFFVVSAITVAGCVCAEYLPVRLPWALDAGMTGLGLFYAGFLYRKYSVGKFVGRSPAFRLGILGLGTVLCMVAICINDEVNLRLGEYGNMGLFFVGAVGSSVLIYRLSRWIANNFANKRVISKTVDMLQMIGRHSLVYIGFSQVINVGLEAWIGKMIIDEWMIQKLIIKGFILILTITIIERIERYLKISRWWRCILVPGRR